MCQIISFVNGIQKRLSMIIFFFKVFKFLSSLKILYFSCSRVQCGFCSRSESCFTPVFPTVLSLRSSSFRCEGFVLSADTTAAQSVSLRLHLHNLGGGKIEQIKQIILSNWWIFPFSSVNLPIRILRHSSGSDSACCPDRIMWLCTSLMALCL